MFETSEILDIDGTLVRVTRRAGSSETYDVVFVRVPKFGPEGFTLGYSPGEASFTKETLREEIRQAIMSYGPEELDR